jgi:hypothetical protein
MDFPTDFAGAGLLGDFIYNAGRPPGAVETVMLGGFVPGTTYEVRFYYRPFGPRPQDVTSDTGGLPNAKWTGVLDEDTPSAENYWSIVFQADTPSITIQFKQQVNNAAWHQYGLSTELVPAPAGQPAAISTQPQSQTVREGGVAAFGVAASGTTPLTFQWRKGSNPVPNATNMVLAITNVTPADAGNYSVVVHNAVSSDAVSDTATLTVGPAADFFVSKAAGLTVNGIPGRTAQIFVSDQLRRDATWALLTNLTLSGTLQWIYDPTLTNTPARFYGGVLAP